MKKVCIFVIGIHCRYKCKIMINRINLILRAKNITARQFAEEIGIQPSGMSHIMGGRNNPSLDFVTKVIRRYPEIDANWLLLGRGEMYTTESGVQRTGNENNGTEISGEKTLFSSLDEPVVEEITKKVEPVPYVHDEVHDEPADPAVVAEPSQYEPTYIAVPPSPRPSLEEGRRLVRMLFIYSDNTFREFLPAE